MHRTIANGYSKLRKNFGKQPQFSLTEVAMLDSIDPNRADQKDYCLRNPIHRETQVSLPFSVHEVNTIKVEMVSRSMNHSEGGWPKELHYNIEEETLRYRRRIEREDSYIQSVMKLAPKFENLIKQNNAVDLYGQYFRGMHETLSFEKSSMKLNNVYCDPHQRPVAGLCWTNEDDPKLAVTYCYKKYPVLGPANTNFICYLWQLECPHTPLTEFLPPTACWSIACSPVNPEIILGGLDDGSVCIFDIRAQKEPISESPQHTHSHRGPVSALLCIQARSNNEFFTSSSDGQCIWYDLRDLSEPLESLLISVNIPSGGKPTFSNAEGVSALQYERTLPTRFLCGTETGLVVNVNRKGKTHSDMMSVVYRAQNGPVRAVHRSPCISKVFLTCGDWRVNIWSDDVKSSPIITGTMHRYNIMDAVWAPEKMSAYMTVDAEGKFRYWDLLRQYRRAVISKKISNYTLLRVVPHDQGRLVAVGDIMGSVFLLSLSEDLVLAAPTDKHLMLQTYERECRREHILTNRIKEIRLKMRDVEEEAVVRGGDEPDPDALDRIAEEEYRRQVIEEIRRGSIITSPVSEQMRKR